MQRRQPRRRVRDVGQHGRVHQRIVGQRLRTARPEPGGYLQAVVPLGGDATLERGQPGHRRRLEHLGRLDVRHGFDGQVRTVPADLERHRHVENDLAVLHRDDPPGGERATVAVPVDPKDRVPPGVAAAQEVPVQRVRGSVRRRRPAGREQRLCRDLTAVDRMRLVEHGGRAVEVPVQLLEGEQFEQGAVRSAGLRPGRCHGDHPAGTAAGRPLRVGHRGGQLTGPGDRDDHRDDRAGPRRCTSAWLI
jgi:hypothetical protein